MPLFLVDVNLPRLPSIWREPDFVYAEDLAAGQGASWSDTLLWEYGLLHRLTIVTKDADFGNRLLVSTTAPHVVHIRVGNMRLVDFRTFIDARWSRIAALSAQHKLINVYLRRIERIG
jgi:predicted nuclease of predicted toxin-antitoxin system